MRFLKAFGRFWYDFVIGDDWKIAAYVVAVLAAVAGLAAVGGLSDGVIAVGATVILMALFVLGVRLDTRRSR